MSYASLRATPSELAASGALDDLRYRDETAVQETVAALVFKRVKLPVAGRILGVDSWLRTGGGNASDCKVQLNGADILTADMAFDGLSNGAEVAGVLDTTHADYDTETPGIRFKSGDVLTFVTTTAGAGALGLNITARLLF